MWEEIGRLLGVENADSMTPGWIGKRMEAIHNVLEKMTDAENQELNRETRRINAEGYPEDIKRA